MEINHLLLAGKDLTDFYPLHDRQQLAVISKKSFCALPWFYPYDDIREVSRSLCAVCGVRCAVCVPISYVFVHAMCFFFCICNDFPFFDSPRFLYDSIPPPSPPLPPTPTHCLRLHALVTYYTHCPSPTFLLTQVLWRENSTLLRLFRPLLQVDASPCRHWVHFSGHCLEN